MQWRKQWRLGLVLVVVTSAFAWFAWRHMASRRGPIYEGHDIAYWFNDRQWMQGPAIAAFRSFGPAAAPFLAAEIRRDESRWSAWYRRRWGRLPLWLRFRAPVPDLPESRREHALVLLGILGPAARAAAPDLLDLVDRTYRERHHLSPGTPLWWAQWMTNPPPPATVAGGWVTNRTGVVMAAARAQSPADHRWQAELEALGQVGAEAPDLLPRLLVVLREASLEESGAVARATMRAGRVSPAALRAAAPLLAAVLQDSDPRMRGLAARLLVLLDGDGKSLLSALEQTSAGRDAETLERRLAGWLAEAEPAGARRVEREAFRQGVLGALAELGRRGSRTNIQERVSGQKSGE